MLGISHATAIVIGTVIGTGIFLVPHEMMQAAGSGRLVYLAWIAGGLLTICGALTYAELGAMMPRSGGEYAFLRNAYGDFPAFLYMWTFFAVAEPASIASIASGLARTLGIFKSLQFFDRLLLARPIEVYWFQLFAICSVWAITGLNYLGVRKAANFQVVFTALKILLVLGIAVFCFTSPLGRNANFRSSFASAQGGVAGFMIALIAALWAYDGWNDVIRVAGEVRRPGRNLPFALIAGVAAVAVLYMLMNAAIQYILPAKEIASSLRPAVAAMSAISGHAGAALVSIGMAVSILVTLNGTTMSGARAPFAAARDGLFLKRLARIHPRFESPSTSLVVQGWISTLLLLLIGRYQQLFELAIFAEWLFYMLTTSTIFVYRRRREVQPQAFRAWGYPVLPAVFILASAPLLYYSFAGNLRSSLLGSAVILAGAPVFVILRRQARAGGQGTEHRAKDGEGGFPA